MNWSAWSLTGSTLQTLKTEETFIPQLQEGGGGECLSYFYYQLS